MRINPKMLANVNSLAYLSIMIHIGNNLKPICQKRFNSNNSVSQNYELTDKERFLEIFKKQPNYCCKKCINISIIIN